MKDPVVLSSGTVVDRSTVYYTDRGSRLFGGRRIYKCPLTREIIDYDVFPVKYIRSQIIDWTKHRINTLLMLAEANKDDYKKLDRVLSRASLYLNHIGEEIY